jgi:general secretion pathway protein N
MRLENVAPRTLLLAVLAGWALLAWALALAGMGRNLPAPTPGAVTAQPLPTVPESSAPGLGPSGQYAATTARPLFAVDRRPHPFSLKTEGGDAQAAAPEFDLVLTSVLITPQAHIAIVQKPDGSAGYRVRVGESAEPYPAWTLVSLLPRSAVFAGPEGERTLALRTFSGEGGSVSAPPGTAPVEMPGRVPTPGAPMPPPVPAPPAPVAPPTDASVGDPAQIEAIRQRIEARRRQMRERAQNSNPPSTVAPPPPASR